ncbi:TonB-dependent receptor [Acidovorax sp. NCPPB 4044]|uniref:TonB-dependent receptor n=1 Tax=Acidovorax sp. NCPPB 4044 TaxID=2940490 RepID=UPI002303E12A|nr:TonB-dependent receptor [Acidovorax sp. NCPPB 4044]MDA8523171.1 TonB-dependent receptor [Acidovorax sp. NCPPB 4044]
MHPAPRLRHPLAPLPLAARLLRFAAPALAALGPAAALAQPMPPAEGAAPRGYAIGPGPLAPALNRLGRESGTLITFDPALAAGRATPGVQGTRTVDGALAALLRGTGLEAVPGQDGAYSLRRTPEAAAAPPARGATVLQEVTVAAAATAGPDALPAAYAGGQVARGARLGLLGQTDTMDAPFHITSITAQAMEDRQTTTVADALAADPSVRSAAPGGDVADAFFIRGFAIGDNNIGEVAFDGLYGVAPNYRLLTDYAERVEVLKGPAAMLYGMSPNSGIGGGINVVPKRAAEDLLRLRADAGTRSQAGGHVDFARRFGEGRAFGVRFNGGRRTGDTPMDHQHRGATLGALALDYTGERTQATLDLLHQQEAVDAPTRRPALAAGIPVPAAPDARRNITQRWEWYDSTEKSALLRVQHALHPQLSAFASAGAAQSDVDRLFNTPTVVNPAGDTRVTPTRARFDVRREAQEAGLRGRFATGGAMHQVTLQWSRYEDRYRMGSVAGSAYTSNLYAPIDRPAQSVAAPATTPQRSGNHLRGIALSDTIGLLDDRLIAVLGVRRQHVGADNFDTAGLRTGTYAQSATTPMAGIVFKPWTGVSFYANAIEGLSKGDTAPGTASNAGEVFAPYKARQREIGVKVDHGRFMTTASLFQIRKPTGLMEGDRFTVGGEQRNRGLELTAYGALPGGWRLHGGATWIDAELTRTGNPATTGRTAVGVPRAQFTLQAEVDAAAVPGLTLTAGAVHTGAQFADAANTQRLPAWTTLDLGLRWRTRVAERDTTFRALVRNATGRNDWAGASTWGTLLQGAPRTLQVSATVDF